MTKRVAILISGGGSNMVKLVKSMKGDHPARPVLVLSSNAEAEGLTLAKKLGVATEVVDHRAYIGDRSGFEATLNARLLHYQPDIICLAGFMRVLSASFVDRWKGKMLNIHPSLLPKYPGLHTHIRAINAGDAESGASVHEVTHELDNGPLLGQVRVPIRRRDTPKKLAARILKQEHKLYPLILRRFAEGNREFLAPD